MKRSLSHSQIETFTSCPRRWYLTKIDRVPQAPSEHLILGDAFHQGVQADGEKILAGMPPLPLPVLRQTFREALSRRARTDDPHNLLAPFQRTEMVRRGEAMLSAYAREVQPHYHPVAVEAAFEHEIPGTEWRFSGRIDARTAGRADMSTILDFKTASKPWREGDEHHKDQASAYLWASAVAGWQPAAKRVTFLVFSGDDVSFRPTTRSDSQIQAYVDDVRATAERIAAAVASGEFPARPEVRFGASSQCRWCGCLGSCDAGQAYLAEHGQTPVVPVVSRDGAGAEVRG